MTIAQFTIDLMKTSIYWVNQEGIIEYANKSASTSLSYQPLELIGLPITTIDPKINLSIWEKHWQHIKSNQTADLETEHFTKDGKSIPLKISAYYAALEEEEYNILRTKDLTNRHSKPLLTATLSIRNTSIRDSIFIDDIDYYDSTGNLVRQYIDKTILLEPLQTIEYVIDHENQMGGTGANFIVNWGSNNPNVKPIFQGIMISTKGQHGLSFVTEGISISQR